MADIIVGISLVLILGMACRHLYREKKRGASCIGCPEGGACSGRCRCHGHGEK